jgi:hypothetical protein
MAVANPGNSGQTEDLGHVGNPSKHCAVDVSAADVDLTDSAHLGAPSVGIYVGTSAPGNIELTDMHGASVLYKNVPQGSYVPGVFVAVVHAGTTVSDIVAVGK